MVLATLKLDDLILSLERFQANSALGRLLKEYVPERKVLHIPDQLPVYLPALRDDGERVPVELAVALHSGDAYDESEDREDYYEDGEADEGAEDEEANSDRVDEHVLWVAIFRLITFLFIHFFIETNASELDNDETYVHRQLKENQSNAFGNKFVRGRPEVYGERTEDCEAGNNECQLRECLADPNLLISRVQRLHLDEARVQV